MEHLDLTMATNGTKPLPFGTASTAQVLRSEPPPSPMTPEAATTVANGEADREADGAVRELVEPTVAPPSTHEPQQEEMKVPAQSESKVGGRGPVVTRLMNALARAAWEAETEAEALAMVGALVPLAIQQRDRDADVLWRAAPGMLQAVAEVTQSLYRFSAYQPLLTLLPKVVSQAVERLGTAALKGRRLSPRLGYLVVTRAAASAITQAEAGWLEESLWEQTPWEMFQPLAFDASMSDARKYDVRMYHVFVE